MSSILTSSLGVGESLSSLIFANRRLKEENEALADELAQCQVDKEFVWSLWKKLQATSPDISEAVAMVIERERQKAEVKDRKVLEILRLKDARIEEVQKEMAVQSKELGLAVQKKLEMQDCAERSQAERASAEAKLAAMAAQLDELRAAASQRACSEEDNELQRNVQADLHVRASQLEKECSSLRADRDHLTSLLSDKDRLLAEHHAEAAKWSHVQKQLQAKHETNAAELEACRKRLRKAERSLGDRVKELESSRAELARLRAIHSQCEIVAHEREAVIRQMTALQQETEKVLRNSESSHVQERASLQGLYSNLNRQYIELKSVEGHLRHEVEETHARLQQSEAEVSRLRGQLRLANQERQRTVGAQIAFPVDEGVQTKYEPDLEVRLKMESLEDQVKMLRDRVNDKNRMIDRLSQEKSELQEEFGCGGRATAGPPLTRTNRRHIRSASEGAGCMGAVGATGDDADTGKRLALTERKLQDAERLLEKRTEQLEALRQAHRRRLQRLKSLLTSYRLMKEQLRIAEEELRRPPKKKMKIKRPPPSDLRKESNSDAAWNELTYFKGENKNLMVAKMNLEEEVDDLRVRVADEVAANHELTIQMAKDREELKHLLRREAARQGGAPTRDMRHELQSLLAKLQESDTLVEDLKANIRVSAARSGALEESNRRLKAEASNLRRDASRRKMAINSLTRKVEKLQHALRSKLCSRRCGRRARDEDAQEFYDGLAAGSDGTVQPGSANEKRHSSLSGGDCVINECTPDNSTVSSIPHFSTPVAKKYERSLKRSLRKLSAAFKGHNSGDERDAVTGHHVSEKDAYHGDKLTDAFSQDSTSTTGNVCSVLPSSSRSSDVESLGQAIAKKAAAAPPAITISSQTSPSLGEGPLAGGDAVSSLAQNRKCRNFATSPIKTAVTITRRSIRVRPTRSTLYHLTSMKQRLLSLQRQVHVLSDAKAACLADAESVRRQCESLQLELAATNQKCLLLRQTNQKLQSDLETFEIAQQQSQDKAAEQDAAEKMAAELRSVESRLRASVSEVTRQGSAVKALKAENEQQREELKDAQEKISRLERDTAQKKVLLDDLRLKLSVARDSVKSEMAALEQKAEEHSKLKLTLEKLKTSSQSMKARLAAVTKERHDYENMYAAAKGEVERGLRQLAASQARSATLQSALDELEAAAQEQLVALAEQGEAAVQATQRQLLASHHRSQQLVSFLSAFSAELLRRGERLRAKKRQEALRDRKRKRQEKKPDESEALRKAKTQAQRILEISAADMDELMDSCGSADDWSAGSDSEDSGKHAEIKDMKWVKRWQALLNSQEEFAKNLNAVFLQKIDELVGAD